MFVKIGQRLKKTMISLDFIFISTMVACFFSIFFDLVLVVVYIVNNIVLTVTDGLL